jgi:mannose-6-phosphate isomerase
MSATSFVPLSTVSRPREAAPTMDVGSLTFTPYLCPKIWGRRRLSQLGKTLPTADTYGESWEISGHAHHESRVQDGPYAGWRLGELCRAHSREILGDSSGTFPWMVKFLDCHDPLSVQVHPSDALAASLLGEPVGKTEAWIVMDAAADARVSTGLRPGVTPSVLRKAINDGTVEDCLAWFQPRVGDCIFLPAGRVHTAQGVLLAEVCQTSDATFRLFDFHRVDSQGQPRELHIEESLAAIDWKAPFETAAVPRPISGLPQGIQGQHLVNCPEFRLDRFRLQTGWSVAPASGPAVWIMLDGAASLTCRDGGTRTLQRGDTVLMPACESRHGYTLAPIFRNGLPNMIRVTLPA